MASVQVRFVGPWRLYLGAADATIEALTVEDALAQVEDKFGNQYMEKLRGRGIRENRSISGDSNVLLNRIHIRQLTDHTLRDGDHIDLIPRFVGG